ncbi:uncharacterized protein [Drosophila takahashii]|uniref:uncharacterized protein n=1 Tax=Drosophila takahashii TaxID=29030 RepID=UPI001CF83478|nr:uncharacterized protein LOC108068127 [Drosophila takahashii]
MLSLKDLNLTKEQMEKLQQLLKEQIKEDQHQDDRDSKDPKEPSMGEAIAKALENIQVYVEAGKTKAFVQLKPPQLHTFEVTPQGVATGSSEADKFNRAEGTEIARWQRERSVKLDLISSKEAEQFGKIQTDERTGETYMLVPMEINVLVDGKTLTPEVATKMIGEQDAYKEETAGHTFYLYHQLEGHPCKLPQAALDQNPQASQVEPVPPENQVNWDYHLHNFEVPRLIFPFELKFGPDSESDSDRLAGGETETGKKTTEEDEDSELQLADFEDLQELLEDLEED